MSGEWTRRDALGAIGAATAFAAAAGGSGGEAEGGEYGSRQGFRGVFGRLTGAKAAVNALLCENTPCVFGVPGAQNNELWDAFKSGGLPYMLVTNESSASVMADASARATGCVGAFCVVPGPGLTNALTGIGEALLDGSPIVGIVTDIMQGPEAHAFQVHSLPGAAILQPVCKAVLPVRHQAEIPGAIHQAFQIARAGEPGPACVVIPFDLFSKVWDYRTPAPPPIATPFDDHAYHNAVQLLSDRRARVGIYAGAGCWNAARELTAVAEILQAPVATSVSGKGAIADSHPLAVGWGYGAQGTRAAELAFKDVDLVLAVGVRYSEVSTANYSIPKHECLIHADANPRNLGVNVPATVKVCADAAAFLGRLEGDAGSIARAPRPELYRKIAKHRELDRSENARVRIDPCVDPMFFYSQMRCVLPPNALIFIDVTVSTHWASEAIAVERPRLYFTPANNQSMGWAIPAAIGARKVRPDCEVAAVSGDGCLLMSAIELSTAAREGLPVRFFVLDDGVYEYMRKFQEPAYRRTTATELARIDYRALAASFGLFYNEITTNADAASGVARALAAPGPVLTRVAISYEGRPIRWLEAVKKSYLKHISGDQKARMLARVTSRTLVKPRDSD